jgi:Ca2+:H+ antiporter
MERVLVGLLILVPVTLALALAGAAEPLIFLTATLALVPLAALLGGATEVVASASGPTIGALLNATFDNAAELIIYRSRDFVTCERSQSRPRVCPS